MLEMYTVRLHQDGQPDQIAEMSVLEDDGDGLIRIRVATPSRVYEGQDSCFFETLCVVRRKLEHDGLLLCVQGAMLGVYPSPMALSMGARVAYRLTLGQPAKTADLVDLFEPVDRLGSTVDEQAQWYSLWLESLRPST
ncbi:hypothetical protein LAJ19_02215 [Deinococcus taeanensis]|uniref:hypothetical protein n=1 Tax=Deinococcus taeanensis TaxID=2737050 RepID=UPI001CDBAEE9|nr:hypothetical protein [Deinococcus taeanensis]UBV43061.1 hypothetical protein LAJ19_02215 [Deinococcus taeanensis]